jgi:hypothetical protein
MASKHVFTLPDRDGTPHTYETTAFRPTAGSTLRYRLGGLVSDTILVALFELRRGEDGDAGKIGAALRTSLQSISLELIRDVLSTTMRDGMMIAAEGAFDAAYERNYAELDAAIWEVINYNDFLSLPGISLGKLVSAVAATAMEKAKTLRSDGTPIESPDAA